jgi:hypothetical protein
MYWAIASVRDRKWGIAVVKVFVDGAKQDLEEVAVRIVFDIDDVPIAR